MVSTSMKEYLIFRTDSACSPQTKLVHKDASMNENFSSPKVVLRNPSTSRPNGVHCQQCLCCNLLCPLLHSASQSNQRDWSAIFARYFRAFSCSHCNQFTWRFNPRIESLVCAPKFRAFTALWCVTQSRQKIVFFRCPWLWMWSPVDLPPDHYVSPERMFSAKPKEPLSSSQKFGFGRRRGNKTATCKRFRGVKHRANACAQCASTPPFDNIQFFSWSRLALSPCERTVLQCLQAQGASIPQASGRRAAGQVSTGSWNQLAKILSV